MLEIYSQFRDFHIFRKFKHLLGDWWSIDILIVVKDGKKFFYDNASQLNNPVVKELLSSSLFKNHFLSSINAVIDRQNSSSALPKMWPWKQTGLNLFAIPLVVKNEPADAFLVAVGFAPGKGEKLFQSLLYLGLSKKAIEQRMSDLKKLSQTDEVYIQRMLRILAEEFFALLQEKQRQDRLKKKPRQKKGALPMYGGLLLGKSPIMKYIFNVLEKIKSYDSSILIEGEKGSGKRLLAKTIHLQSSRSKKPFHLQNFSAFTGKLLELELFGYNPSAFPKSPQSKPALLEKLNGGALLLNEIENTSLEFQGKLLRFLKEGVFLPEGSVEPKKSDVRIIIATNKNLKTLVEKGYFNEDLYFAISVMTVKVPPLKQRKEDIPLLIEYFLKTKSPLSEIKISPKAMTALYNYSWPGNIRELENEIEKIVSLSPKGQNIFTERDLSPHIRDFSSALAIGFQPGKQNLKDVLRSIEKQILVDCLKKNNWNKSRVAKMLGASRTSIILKTKEYGIIKEEGA